jgi:hypothetical protein
MSRIEITSFLFSPPFPIPFNCLLSTLASIRGRFSRKKKKLFKIARKRSETLQL